MMRFFRPKAPTSGEGDNQKDTSAPKSSEIDFAQVKAKISLISDKIRCISETNQNVIQATTFEREAEYSCDLEPAVLSANSAISFLKENFLERSKSIQASQKVSALICKFADVVKDLNIAQKKYLIDTKKKFKRQIQIVRPDTTTEEIDILFMASDNGLSDVIKAALLTGESPDAKLRGKMMSGGMLMQNSTAVCLQNSIKDTDALETQLQADFPMLSEPVLRRSLTSIGPLADKTLAVELFQAVKSAHFYTLTYLLNHLSLDEINCLHATHEDWSCTALMHAASEGSEEIVKMFIHAGVDLNTQNERGFTAVSYVANKGCKHKEKNESVLLAKQVVSKFGNRSKFGTGSVSATVVQALAEAHADLNIKTNDGRTALMCAASKGLHNIVSVLVQFSADVNAQDNEGDTALAVAVNWQHRDIVSALLDAGADRSITNKEGKTPAELPSTDEIVALLKTHGQAKPASTFMSFFRGAGTKNTSTPADNTAQGSAVTSATKTSVPAPSSPVASSSAATVTTAPKMLTAPASNADTKPVPVAAPKLATTATPPSPALPAALSPAPTPVSGAPSVAKPRASIFGFGSSTTAAAAPPPAPAPQIPAQFTEEDRAALLTMSQSSTQTLLVHGRLNEMMLTMAAHDRALSTLVSKQKECPSLFWFYPKNRELRNWLSNPAKCLFQDTLMLVVVCPVTLCVVECGPKGVGWEVTMPKQWVKKWGPAIIFSIYVLQTAVLAGRIVGIPLPQLPSVSNITGLSSTLLGDTADKLVNQKTALDSLKSFAATTAATLDKKCPEVLSLCADIQKKSTEGSAAPMSNHPLPAPLPLKMMDETYRSIHTYLTTGDHAKLGKLEDQLRGRMERVLAENGNIEWVSVEGKDIWLEKNKRVAALAEPEPVPAESTIRIVQVQVAGPPATTSAASAPSVPSAAESWLAVKLAACAVSRKHIADCEQKLIEEQGFTSEEVFAAYPPDEFHTNYLRVVGISAGGLQVHLLRIYSELRAQYHPPPAVSTPALETVSPIPVTAEVAAASEEAAFSKDEKETLMNSVRSLTQELSKLRAANNGAGAGGGAAQGGSKGGGGGGGGKGGLMQKQAQATTINPMTQQPYTMDELVEQLMRMERLLGRVDQRVDGVAAAADERIEQLRTESAPLVSAGASDAKKGSWSLFSAKK